jgi:hydrogenase maturation protease
MLYPYRPSALKNRSQGWSFGSLLPPRYVSENSGESDFMQGEVLFNAMGDAVVNVEARFLQLVEGTEARERAVETRLLIQEGRAGISIPFSFDSNDPNLLGVRGVLEVNADGLDKFFKLTIRLRNQSESGQQVVCRDQALTHALIAAHALVTVENGRCISLLDPPEEFRGAVSNCKQIGIFPVMIGDETEQNAMLLSPTILYDYPKIATQSKGDFFDSTEIDEMLSLRVLTLTDAEKEEIRAAGGRVSQILQRTEALSHCDLSSLHGIMQPVASEKER